MNNLRAQYRAVTETEIKQISLAIANHWLFQLEEKPPILKNRYKSLPAPEDVDINRKLTNAIDLFKSNKDYVSSINKFHKNIYEGLIHFLSQKEFLCHTVIKISNSVLCPFLKEVLNDDEITVDIKKHLPENIQTVLFSNGEVRAYTGKYLAHSRIYPPLHNFI